MKFELAKWMVKCYDNRKNCLAQSVIIRKMKLSWNTVTSYVFKGLIMGQILFSIFIIDLDDETVHTQQSLRFLQN